jgi:hypothetical protein
MNIFRKTNMLFANSIVIKGPTLLVPIQGHSQAGMQSDFEGHLWPWLLSEVN